MAFSPPIGDEDFIAVFPDNGKRSGDKRASEGSSDEEDLFGSKKKRKIDSGPGAATGMILSLRESLQNYKDKLATCQAELEEAQLEIQKWYSAFQNGPASPTGTKPDPELAVIYLQNLNSSVEALKQKLVQTKKREGAITVAYAQREKENVELKIAAQDLRRRLRPPSIQTRQLLLDPAIHAEFTRLKNLVDEKEKKVKELEEQVAAINFSANSKMGNMLMAKCRTLQEENEEIGAIASEGKVHVLGMTVAVLNSENERLRKQYDALYKYVESLLSGVDRSNELVYVMQEKLEAKEYELQKLKDELKEKVMRIQSESVVDLETVYKEKVAHKTEATEEEMNHVNGKKNEMDAVETEAIEEEMNHVNDKKNETDAVETEAIEEEMNHVSNKNEMDAVEIDIET